MKITNECLEELITLEESMKIISKRVDELKTACKERGTFSTGMYACVVSEQTRVGLAGMADVISVVGREVLELHGLIRTTTYLTVKVSRKIPLSEYRNKEL